MVTRGCRAASSSDDQNVISRYLRFIHVFCFLLPKTDVFVNRTNRTLGMSCRLTDFCNSFDANRLVQRTNSASGMAFIYINYNCDFRVLICFGFFRKLCDIFIVDSKFSNIRC